MKVLTKRVTIENQDFVLIQDEKQGRTFYGTIPYTELNEKGAMKRALNGAEMSIDFKNPAKALHNRKVDLVIKRLTNHFMKQGLDVIEAMKKVVETDEYKALYA